MMVKVNLQSNLNGVIMNKNELKAYNWLKEQGYSSIVFHQTSTPDFTTDTIAFEVKTLVSNTIIFAPKQFGELSKYSSVRILVFNGASMPIANIPFSEISNGQTPWDNIHIRQLPLSTKGVKPIVLSLSTYQQLMSHQQYNETREGIILKLLDIADRYDKICHKGKYSK